MTYTFKLSRRLARFRGLAAATILLSIAGCNSTDSLDPESSAPPSSGGEPSLATTSFSGGIPIGIFALPTTYFGSTYNGAKETIGPYDLKNELAAIKSRGGRIVLMMAGSESNYKDANGHFSLTLWKQRIDRFRGIDFSSYISDGTIIAHYLIDEPQDPSNWNGVTIPPSTVDAMGQYSKQLWPGMATVVRTVPRFFPSSPRYIDAAWAQYLSRFGDPADYLSQNVADAQARGLQLIVGLNLQDGGLNKGNMTPSQVQTWGSAMLSSSYPCAFISWTFDASYLGTSDMKNAMAVLRSKAENRSQRSCGGGAATAPGTTPTPTPSPSPTPTNALPFGLSLPPATEYTSQWTGAVYRADPADLVSRLALSRSAGIRLIASLARPAASKNADGTFNMTKWKAEVDQFRSLSLGQYVTDQSLYLHLLVDQPNCASCWGGKAIPWSTVEAMAQYSKSIWPALRTTVRVAPTELAKAGFHWNYLDAGWAQYNTRLGDLPTYVKNQVAAAQQEGLGLVAGLNLTDGAGYNTASMTASQIKQFGTILAKQSAVCALVGWKYDATYMAQSGIRAALDSVATVAKKRTPASCSVS
jgi:hypothetical protein